MIKFKDKIIETDKEGYLKNTSNWNEEIAKLIAKNEGIYLSNEHIEIIHFVRRFYLEFNISPNIRILVKLLSDKFGTNKGNSIYLYRLFPNGPAKQASKIAGIPKPIKCI